MTRSRGARVVAVLGVLVFWAGVFGAGALVSGYSAREDYISSLASRGSPVAALGIAALLANAAAHLATASAVMTGWRARLCAAFLVAAGVALTVVAGFRQSCPDGPPRCGLSDAPAADWVDVVHGASVGVYQLFTLAAMLTLTVGALTSQLRPAAVVGLGEPGVCGRVGGIDLSNRRRPHRHVATPLAREQSRLVAACRMDRHSARARDRRSTLTARTAGIAALSVSIGAGMASNVLFLAAFQFRLDWFRDPIRILGAGPTSAELFRWASVLDLIGYYLATGVLAYVLWQWLRPRNPLVADLSALAAGGYVLAGGIGAAALAMVGPMLMHRYTDAAPADQAVIAVQFAVLLELVWRAIWQLLDGIFMAGWWLGIALLVRADRPGLSRLSLALAAAAVVGVGANIIGLGLVRDVMLGITFALWTAWWIWLLVLLLRSKEIGQLPRNG